MLREVHLHGHLGERHGRVFHLDVDSPLEAIRSLCMQLPGFRKDMREGHYRITRGDLALPMEQLTLGMGRCKTIHVVPTPVVGGIEIGLLGWVLLGAAVVAVAALAFMPTIKPPTPGERENKETNFLFDGAVNVNEQGHPVPLIYGRWRVGSVVVSSEIETTDVLPSALPELATGGWSYNNDPALEAINYNIGSWIILNKGGKGGGGQSQRVAQEDPNTLQSQSVAKVIDLIGEGEIVGLVDGLRSVYFDGTPVQNPDGSFNFKGVSIDFRVGLPDQDYMPGFSDQATPVEVNRAVTTTVGPIVQTITDADANRARVTLGLNALYQQNTSNGDMLRSNVPVRLELQANGGGYTTVLEHAFDGKTVSKYQRAFDIALPAGGHPWNIRVTRLIPDRTTTNFVDEVTWDLLQEIVDAKLIFPNSAYAGLIVDAKQFGSRIPTRSYDVLGLIVEVPTNFDPQTRVYATSGPGTSGGIWDGTFKRAWTDEPVWCWRDLCLNKRYGIGRRLGVNNVDKNTLYMIAQRNAGLVPNGSGGWEPRHTFNAYFKTQGKAYDVLVSVAATFRSVVFSYNDTIALAQDAPGDPVQLVVPANTIEGEINYETLSSEGKASGIVVHYNDPDDEHRLAFEIVEDPGLRRRIGWKTRTVVALGETRRGGAARFGRWLLEDQSLDERASWGAPYDQARLTPQEIVAIQDPDVSGQMWGGRLSAATTTTATLDRQVTLVSGRVYTLKMMQRDGTVASRVLTNSPGTTAALTWSSALGSAPASGAIWSLESDTLFQTQWRVETREEVEGADPHFSIRAMQHDPLKYDRVELGLKLEPRPTSSLPSGPIELPSGLSYREFIKLQGEVGIPSILFSWRAANDIRVIGAQVQVKRPGSSTYEPVPWLGGVGVEINDITPGEHTILVRFIDGLGRYGQWSALTDSFDGLPPPPDRPGEFFAYPGVDGVRFTWTPVTTHGSTLDYEIRQGSTWEEGQYICRVESDTVTVKLPVSAAFDKTFWMAARVKGTTLYSAAIFTTTYQANLPNVNVVVSEDFQAGGWSGSKRRLEVVDLDGDDALRLSIDPDTTLRYPWGDYRDNIDLGAIFYARCYLELLVRNVSEIAGPAWQDLDVAWQDLGDMAWSPADGALTDISAVAYISMDTAPSHVLEAWPLGSSNAGIIDATQTMLDIATTVLSNAGLHGYGAGLSFVSVLAWDSVPFDSTRFTITFVHTPNPIPAEDRVLFVATNGTQLLQLVYDFSDDMLYLSDGTNQLALTPPDWQLDEAYLFAIVQTATTWSVCWVSSNESDGRFATGPHAQAPAVFDEIYLGGSGVGAQEDWDDSTYTWDDLQATRAWDELTPVFFAAPGAYSDLQLSSSLTLVEADSYLAMLPLQPPAGYAPYRPLLPGDYNFRRAWVWHRIAAPTGGGQNAYLTRSVLHVDVPDVFDDGTAAIGASDTVVNFNKFFHAAPKIGAVIIAGATPAVVDIAAKTATNFTVRLRSMASPSTLVAGTIDWTARGY